MWRICAPSAIIRVSARASPELQDSFADRHSEAHQFGAILSAPPQNVDVYSPVQPQGHDLPIYPAIPTFPPLTVDPGNDPEPAPSDPTQAPAPQPAPFDPSLGHLFSPFMSSSSESEEYLINPQQLRPVSGAFVSSSEEIGGPVALRPPLSFRYKKLDRKKRQALTEATPTHNPMFLTDFPGGTSPFRSCPGPARYTTV